MTKHIRALLPLIFAIALTLVLAAPGHAWRDGRGYHNYGGKSYYPNNKPDSNYYGPSYRPYGNYYYRPYYKPFRPYYRPHYRSPYYNRYYDRPYGYYPYYRRPGFSMQFRIK